MTSPNVARAVADAATVYGELIANAAAKAETQLIQDIARVVARGLTPYSSTIEKQAALTEVRAAAARAVLTLAQVPGLAEELLLAAADQGARAALDQLLQAGTTQAYVVSAAVPGGLLAASVIAQDLAFKITQFGIGIVPFAADAYRIAIGEAALSAVMGGNTVYGASADAWRALAAQGITGFTDRNFRRWQLSSYVEMATRSAVIRAYTDASVIRASSSGMDLFRVIGGRDACDKCGPYLGRILTTTGQTGRVVVRHATDDNAYLTVDVADTIAGARSNGWQHPNCRCTLVVYFPGLPVPRTVTVEDPAGARAQATQRSYEVQVRAMKRLQAAATTPQEAAVAAAGVARAQARIRAHIVEHDLPRRSHREQIGARNTR